MSSPDDIVTCPDCGYQLRRPEQDRCAECGLRWNDWMDSRARRIRMQGRDWFLLFVVFPIMASIPPLLTARGAVTGARTFESSYLLTIPGFAGILFLAWWYATPVLWRVTRSRRGASGAVSRPPSRVGSVAVFFLLLLLQVFLFLAAIRLGFMLFVQPLRPPPPANLQSSRFVIPIHDHVWMISRSS